MRPTTHSALLTFALVVAGGGVTLAQDQANPPQVAGPRVQDGPTLAEPSQETLDAIAQATTDEEAFEAVIDWVGEEPERIEAALAQLGIDETAEIVDVTDPFVGTYKLKSGRVTLTILPNGDDTYSVTRVYEPKRGKPATFLGLGSLDDKETITGKTILRVGFRPERSGVAGHLEAMEQKAVDPSEGMRGVYKIDAEIGRIQGNFYTGEKRQVRRAGSRIKREVEVSKRETGWRVGATPVSFFKRTRRSASIMVGKIRQKMGKIRASLAARVAKWREGGLQVKAKLAEFWGAVKAKLRAGWDATTGFVSRTGDRIGDAARSAGRAIRNRGADAMEWSGDRLHDGANAVRIQDAPGEAAPVTAAPAQETQDGPREQETQRAGR
jgi:hypothetical protein